MPANPSKRLSSNRFGPFVQKKCPALSCTPPAACGSVRALRIQKPARHKGAGCRLRPRHLCNLPSEPRHSQQVVEPGFCFKPCCNPWAWGLGLSCLKSAFKSLCYPGNSISEHPGTFFSLVFFEKNTAFNRNRDTVASSGAQTAGLFLLLSCRGPFRCSFGKLGW